ncbi:MAG: bifunctional DNA primase/polymerase [Acidimicrobiales bacterium]
MSELLEAALDYAGRRWRVFPCEPGGKRPLGRLCPHGLKDATTEIETIAEWWAAEPEANIGLPTGLHFDVLDIDGPDALCRLEDYSESQPGDQDVEGPTASTPRGWHAYVKATDKGNTVNLGGLDGIDWRGRGGYVVAPPSVKEDGGTWTWMTGADQDLGADTPIIPAPAWVLALFERRKPVTNVIAPGRHAGRTGYGAAALERELGRLALAAEGTRNHQLNASAHSLGQLIASGHLDTDEVLAALLTVGRQIGLTDDECVKTIGSGVKAGMQSPRRVA